MKKLLGIFLSLVFIQSIVAQPEQPVWLSVVYIGNSITQGVMIDNPRKNAPPVKASIYLRKQPGIGEVRYSNQGVSGNTTVDFLPETGTWFPKVKAAADELYKDSWTTLVFSIMLGTNDSAVTGPNGSPVSPEQYYVNMKRIIDELLVLYPRALVVIHQPLWYSPTTYNNSIYLEEGLERLQSYTPRLDQLILDYQASHPLQVFWGDRKGYEYFRENHETLFFPEDGNAGVFYLHPNPEGAARLGELWGEAIYRVIKQE